MLPAQTKLSGIRIPKEFKSWINIKKVFSSFYNKNAAGTIKISYFWNNYMRL